MRRFDKLVMVQSLLGFLVAGAIGCGDDAKPQTKRDGSMDLAADASAPDLAKADTLVPGDMAKTDAPAVDAAQTDVAQPLDTATLDVPSPLDVGQGETAFDTGGVDTGLGPDGARADGPSVLDGGSGETGAGIDSTGAVDAGATTMANVTFRLDNQGTQTVYLYNACWVPLTVTSTADGTEYTNALFCACNCADSTCTESVKCAPCAPPSGVAVAAGQTSDLPWKAGKFTLETKTGSAGSFQCLGQAPIATGNYRVAVTVYPTEVDAVAKTNGRIVQQSFVLGTTNATVVVPIQ
jgi:hypothetical protein